MTGFIQDNYPRVPINNKIKGYVQLTRPFTVVSAFIISILIYTYATIYHGSSFSIITAILIGSSISLVHAFGQVLNQTQKDEIMIDRENGKTYRPIVNGLISPRNGTILGGGYLILGLIFAITVDIRFFMMCCLLSFFAWSYTYRPFRFKEKFILNNAVQAFSRGFLPFVAIFIIFELSPLPFIYGGIISIWVFGAQTSKDWNDIDGDRKFNVKTLPVVLGKNTLWFIGISFIVSFSLLSIFILLKLLPIVYVIALILVLPSILILVTSDKKSITENNMSWMIFYITLALWSLMPLIGVMIW